MGKMGFAPQWIDLVMQCVTTSSYTVCVNGKVSSTFKPTRRLHQGHPLNPFFSNL